MSSPTQPTAAPAPSEAPAQAVDDNSTKEPYVQVDPKKVASYELGLATTDDYHTCYHKLRPHIAYMLELLRLNKSWVPQDTVDGFEEVFQGWLKGIEKKNTGGSVKELATRRGHTETTALFTRYLALRKSIEDESKNRTVLPPPPPTIALLSTIGKPTPSSPQAGPSKPREEIPEIQAAA
ncbi:hypothetical protein FRC04_007846 [Tulasnella sp. 424]|nr:hypothetical protein FRC04_007846 [Tulasnella sp. 424]KAG8975031.1 hypothetical protein FRC05_006454 [Tulasnella sp. 425]